MEVQSPRLRLKLTCSFLHLRPYFSGYNNDILLVAKEG